MEKNKTSKGITLIALIITIIIMLILAGVAISVIVDADGLFLKTRNASEEYQNASEVELNQINGFVNQIDKYLAGIPIKPDGDNNGNVEEDTPQMTEYGYQETRYLVVDIFDREESKVTTNMWVSINELEVFDSNNEKITYSIPYVYDTYTKGVPYYWNGSTQGSGMIYDKSNLQDGNTAYGDTSTTLFYYTEVLGSGNWARLLIDLGEVKEVKKVNLWHGGSAGNTPKEFNIYTVNNKEADTIYDENIKVRNNTDLDLIFSKSFDTACLTSTLFETRLYIGEKPIINAKVSTDSMAPAPVDIIVNASDRHSGIAEVKWLEGNKEILDFETDGHIINAQDKIQINKNGVYSIYARDNAGIENVIHINVTNIDNPPVIVLNGTENTIVVKGNEYVDSGATVQDDRTTDFTINVNGTVDTSVLGEYTLTYTATPDEIGNTAVPVTKTVYVINSAHFLIEVYDHLASNGANINELEFRDRTGNKISYTLGNVYDSARNGNPYYWNGSPISGSKIHDKSNLNDGNIAAANNDAAAANCTLFLHESNPNTGKWARLMVSLSGNNIGKTRIAIGQGDYLRIPKKVTVYAFENYNSTTAYNTNIKARNDTGLIKLKEFTFTNTFSSPTWFEFVY